MQHIFISYSSNDAIVAAEIYDELAAHGIHPWMAMRDIKPGATWDITIEEALVNSKCVLVMCSPASVTSSYVRAEVEAALRQDKTVIPIIIEDCSLPIRWNMLQYLRWNEDRGETFWKKLIASLPDSSISIVKNALDDPNGIDIVRSTIKHHYEWLPLEAYMRDKYYGISDAEIMGEDLVDIFAARMDSSGPRAFMYYLGNHSDVPFEDSGEPCYELGSLGHIITWHTLNIRKPLPKKHALSPPNIFSDERDEWRAIGRHFSYLNIYIFFGRRAHYTDVTNQFRKDFLTSVAARWKNWAPPMHVNLELASYDRLLNTVDGGSIFREPKMP